MAIRFEALSKRQFEKYCALIYRESGINLSNEKRALLNARIAKRLRKLDVSANRYYKMILEDHEEMERFIDAVSTNHTYFFRESTSFQFIRPDYTDIWCAACSSGEEPYSLAAYCLHQGGMPSILATDISDTCLQKARRGVYSDKCIGQVPEPMLKAYFQKGLNQWHGSVRVKSQVRKMVRFGKFNLLKDIPPDTHFDVILCRNVMIYFDRQTKENVVARLCRALKPQGYFIIGGAESLSGLTHELKYIKPSVYFKP